MEEIDRSRWQECLTIYRRRHDRWLARLECEGHESTGFAPLSAIDATESRLAIRLGAERYELPHPRRISRLTSAEGDHGLQIELADRTVVLRFRVPARPEMIGG